MYCSNRILNYKSQHTEHTIHQKFATLNSLPYRSIKLSHTMMETLKKTKNILKECNIPHDLIKLLVANLKAI